MSYLMRVKRSLEDAIKRKEEIYKILNSYEHYGATPTLDYGTHDPFQVELTPCVRCGAIPEYKEVMRSFSYWKVLCKCGNHSGTFVFQWKAALDWRNHNLRSQDYRQIPLFGIQNLTLQQAKERLIGIRDNLQLRNELNEVYRVCAEYGQANAPGKKYERRIRAYLEWARLAIRIIKHQEYVEATNANLDNRDAT
jgi:hypothetical protein